MVMIAIVLGLTLGDLAWLAGDWQLTRGNSCIEEHWTLPSSDSLVGLSRTLTNNRTSAFEFVRIEARADGIYYVAQPGGHPPLDFRLASESAEELVFVNPGHADHLKRIVYRRDGDDGLAARIDGEDAGRAFAVDYNYHRVASSSVAGCGAGKQR